MRKLEPDTVDLARRHSRYRTLERLTSLDRQALAAAKPRPFAPRSSDADPQRLRGIPAIGRNVSGHIPGTDPAAQWA